MDARPEPTVAERLRAELPTLATAERRVARALLADYPLAGLETLAVLAGRAGTSGPTVLRLLGKLGFDGYGHLQQALRAELAARLAGPAQLYPGTAGAEPFGPRVGAGLARAVTATLAGVDATEIETAAELLADPRRAVYLVGGRWSGALAEFGALHLGLLRPGVHAVPQPPAARRALLLDLERRCVVVAFDYRRYQRDTIAFGADAARAGASLVLFTDHLLSPLAAHACVVLTSSIDAGSPFTVLTPALALLETLVTRVLDRIGPASVARMARLDALAEGVFVPGGGPGDERIPDEAPAPKEST